MAGKEFVERPRPSVQLLGLHGVAGSTIPKGQSESGTERGLKMPIILTLTITNLSGSVIGATAAPCAFVRSEPSRLFQ
jgi:hypothetical protein